MERPTEWWAGGGGRDGPSDLRRGSASGRGSRAAAFAGGRWRQLDAFSQTWKGVAACGKEALTGEVGGRLPSWEGPGKGGDLAGRTPASTCAGAPLQVRVGGGTGGASPGPGRRVRAAAPRGVAGAGPSRRNCAQVWPPRGRGLRPGLRARAARLLAVLPWPPRAVLRLFPRPGHCAAEKPSGRRVGAFRLYLRRRAASALFN